MNQKFKLPLAIAIASAVLVGCSSNKVKEAKPNPLPKLTESKKALVPVFSRSVSSTNKADPLRLQLDASDGVVLRLTLRVKLLHIVANNVFGRKK